MLTHCTWRKRWISHRWVIIGHFIWGTSTQNRWKSLQYGVNNEPNFITFIEQSLWDNFILWEFTRNSPLQFSYNISINLHTKLFSHTLPFASRIIYQKCRHKRALCRERTCRVTDYYIQGRAQWSVWCWPRVRQSHQRLQLMQWLKMRCVGSMGVKNDKK